MKHFDAADCETPVPAERVPALLSHPSKLFVEVTTRCNLHCQMCVKHTPGSGVREGDLPLECFAALAPALPKATSLVLNGIGEPLLHPELEEFIARAKHLMAHGSWVGFQSNGLLLDRQRARSLVQAGLDRICLSVDAVSPETFRHVREGAEVKHLQRAFLALNEARTKVGRADFQIGVEFVVRRDNLPELPRVLRWAASLGAGFAIVTHMISYDPVISAKVAYDQNTDEAVALFEEWRRRAEDRGIDLFRYFDVRWRYQRSDEEQRLVDFVEAMVAEASRRNIFVHLRSLFERDERFREQIGQIFEEARTVALENGLDLRLPAITPQGQKRCDFIEAGGAFVSWDGKVHPCYFLWHRYSCFVSGWHKYVNPKVFGSVSEKDLLEIWNDNPYRSFRETVLSYNYPCCSNCNLAPCDYIDSRTFEQDCYTNTIPCCDCQWCLGVFQCLQ